MVEGVSLWKCEAAVLRWERIEELQEQEEEGMRLGDGLVWVHNGAMVMLFR